MKVIQLPGSGKPRRRVLHIDLTDPAKSDTGSLGSDMKSDLRRADRSMASVAEDLTKATLEGIRRYRRERASQENREKSLRRIPLHAARATVVAIEAAEGTVDEVEKVIDESALRRRLRRALRR